MASNTFGRYFTLTTAGESHGLGYVGILDGVSSGFSISLEEIQNDLDLRAPGRSLYTSKRKEPDRLEIFSGLFEGKTLGTPIGFLIRNQDQKSEDYAFLNQNIRPGHADFTYLNKYTHVDLRGGGRASARETVLRVVAGSIAKQIIRPFGIDILADVRQIGAIRAPFYDESVMEARQRVLSDPFGCHHAQTSTLFMQLVENTLEEKDSLPSSICFRIDPMIPSLGEPICFKMTSAIANALMTIPAAKGVIFGNEESFRYKKGSEFNDPYELKEGQMRPAKNDAAGVLGGISTGEPIYGEVFFKAPSSVAKEQKSLNQILEIKGRHDPLIAPRARIVVESMLWMTLMDQFLAKGLHQNPRGEISCLAK
ncbi:MAG: chorismate synthase [Chlamydiae bacterium]|nr:chorismate synthase [Chlamydiota bacterium]